MNEDEDFRKYCYNPILDKRTGVSVEDLVKMFRLSIIVAKDKLDGYAKKGRLVVDSSLEGTKYYLNDIITCVFE